MTAKVGEKDGGGGRSFFSGRNNSQSKKYEPLFLSLL